ncbi:MAG: MBL fold metallo-hydrolase [Alphaproteobacteria bacterium]|nr:MBL fold metallo-hydrolase [Alphaproteobacteria bacterium]|tara:strand:- start:1735 stop:2571 length:837 start_codon:yes stop_codon:yes gene_type:complete
MNGTEPVEVRFWGVRGSIACPSPETIAFGGNTSCVEIQCGASHVILDAGTGIRQLGNALVESGGVVDADILLSHTHLDHIVGLPFFGPAYCEDSNLRMWAGHLGPDHQLKKVLGAMMGDPLFPIPMDVMAANKSFGDFHAGETLNLACGARVKTCPLNHPNGATGYRVEQNGRAVCYVTDTEHVEGMHDEHILALIQDADVFIYDANYTDEEYEAHRGWGHSTWQVGAELAEMANVKTFVPFHHDPSHDDDAMSQIEAEARGRFENTVVAREGLTLTL